jgi:serine protease inhibitor
MSAITPVAAFGCTLVEDMFSIGDENKAVSPYSIWTALALAECATEDLSEANVEMGRLLRFDLVAKVGTSKRNEKLRRWYSEYKEQMRGVTDEAVVFKTANAVFTKGELDNNFKHTCKYQFDTAVLPLTGKDKINEFVAENTNRLITDVVRKDPPDVVHTILVNVAYFKAAWKTAFNADMTTPGVFTSFEDGETECDMMEMKGMVVEMNYTETYQLVKLEYGTEGQFSAFIASPITYMDGGDQCEMLHSIVHELFGSDTSWVEATALLEPVKIESLKIPRFTAEGRVGNLKKYMKTKGVSKVFEHGGLHDLTSNHSDSIDKISHMTTMHVNEKGTEAAASTVASVSREIVTLAPPVVFDRPFIFTVVHNPTSTMMFAARVNTV